MTPPPPTFSPSLSGSGAEELRTALRAQIAAGPPELPVAVATLFNLWREVQEEPAAPGLGSEPETLWILLDLHRVILFRPAAGGATVSCLVRHLVDGYPIQPFSRFAAQEAEEGYTFSFDPGVLALIGPGLGTLQPGEARVCHLHRGEITGGRPLPHPESVPPVLEGADPETVEGLRPAGDPLRPRKAGRNLRVGPPPELGDLYCEAWGPLRQDDLETGFASLPFATTLVSWHQGRKQEFCFGKSTLPSTARAVARCEALERLQIAHMPAGERLIYGSYRELAGEAVDPRTLFLGRYPEGKDEGLPLFDPDARLTWTWAWGPARGEWRLVPAQEVWFNLRRLSEEPIFVHGTTNGCALGGCFEEAALFAAFEAIERDAFMTSWYLQRPAREIDLDSVPNSAFQALRQRFELAFPGYRPHLFDLTSDIGLPTIGGLALRRRGKGPASFAAAATHPDPLEACLGALKDLTGFRPELPEERLGELRRHLTHPQEMSGPASHFELFALEESLPRLDYLGLGKGPGGSWQELGRESPLELADEVRLDQALKNLARRLEELGAGLYLRDLTHPWLAERGLAVVRALTPRLYPIWFGPRSRRFAVTPRLERLARRYTGKAFDPEGLELGPHPLS